MFDPEEEVRREDMSGFEPIEEPTEEEMIREDDTAPVTTAEAEPLTDETEAPADQTQAEPETRWEPEKLWDPETETAQAEPETGEREPDYADAHFEPAGDGTVPPRYYTPPQRTARESKPKKQHSGGWLKAVCLALVCALLGGLVGSALTGRQLSGRIDALEQSLQESSTAVEELRQSQSEAGRSALAVSQDGGVAASRIYEQACQQVVGITTNVTTTNFFGMTTSAAVSGSGFIISEDGYIITNYHVIEYADQGKLPVTVMTYDGTQYEATIVGTEQANDIAVLKIEASGLSPVTFGDSSQILVGDTVYAVGNPLGELEFSMSTGHVSALDRVISTEESEAINMFQIDAAVNHGNSGGPVYNSLGQVIGVVTAKYSDTDVEGLGFAIPINDAARIAEDLITKGYVTGKAYLGVSLNSDYGVDRYSIAYAQYYNMPLGAYVESVMKGGAAEKAGLQKGDIITQLGDSEISSYTDLKNAIKHYSAGDSAALTFYRAGESQTVTVTFDEAVPEGVNN